jgi:hypothetical protein
MENTKYMVKVNHMFSTLIEVEAPTKEEAIEIAKEEITTGKNVQELKMYYESTFPTKDWAVISKEDYLKIKEEVQASIQKEEFQNEQLEKEESNIITPNNFS